MPQSKVKSVKQRRRLLGRQQSWETIPSDKRNSTKSGRPIFTKPGSNKK